MASRPLIVFPRPEVTIRSRRGSGPERITLPLHARQRERLSPQIEHLESAFAAKRVEMQNDPLGALPEQVLVLETVGSISDFLSAVKVIPGMQWLGEWDEEDIPPDEDFFQDDEHKTKHLGGQVFLILTNQRAMAELQTLWQTYRASSEASWPRGRTKWRDLFSHLRNIRPWDARDRLESTGVLEDWRERIEEGQEIVRLEIELWFRLSRQERQFIRRRIELLLQEENGRFVSETIITEIAYHSILAELPINSVRSIIEHQDTLLVRCDQVMFFRPVGQAAVVIPRGDTLYRRDAPANPPAEGEPIVALLDGLPLQNHVWLGGRLRIDDPDSWADSYAAIDRRHGTAMASLIIHGEIDSQEPALRRPIYVRPILRPSPHDWRSHKHEIIPEDALPVDIVHRAIRRIFEGESGTPSTAPTICIVNLSVGDRSRPFDRFPSPWARLLDYLSCRYNVLFVVSAGNYVGDVILSVPSNTLSSIEPAQLEQETIKAIAAQALNRRLLAPAEAINALTVGASHDDQSETQQIGNRKNLLRSSKLPSPISRLGPGFRRAVKPEVLMAGGKQLYDEGFNHSDGHSSLQINRSIAAPGQAVAAPGASPGDLSAIQYVRGTSNAAALITRAAARLYDVIQQLTQETSAYTLDDECTPNLLRALIVHSANWGDAYGILDTTLRTTSNSRIFKEHAARFLGYGPVDIDRVFACTDQRVTILGGGEIGDDQAHVYSLPLPPSLSGQLVERRLIITLSWFTPINARRRTYRKAELWFDPPTEALKISRSDADWQAVRRGTVQHEVLEGKRATPYTDGELELPRLGGQ